MNNPEEGYARDIANKLSTLLPCDDDSTTITSGWREMSWKCVVESDTNCCHIYCSDREGQPSYYVSFSRQPRPRATGRTQSEADLLASVVEWMNGASLSSLYERFEYIDAIKRAHPHVERKYIQKDHARHLHAELTARFDHDPTTEVTVSGGGVHWKCTAQRAQNACSICCFDRKEAAEYAIAFKMDLDLTRYIGQLNKRDC